MDSHVSVSIGLSSYQVHPMSLKGHHMLSHLLLPPSSFSKFNAFHATATIEKYDGLVWLNVKSLVSM